MATCPANGCNEEHGSHLFMCSAHWRRVPADLKIEINVAWRARLNASKDPDMKMAAYRPLAARHEKAKAAALAWVNEGT